MKEWERPLTSGAGSEDLGTWLAFKEDAEISSGKGQLDLF